MAGFSGSETIVQRVVDRLHLSWSVMAPVTGADGICRLQEMTVGDELPPFGLPFFPLKKLLLPDHQLLWSYQDGEYRSPSLHDSLPQVALINVAPCDLYALAYLDATYADDPLYQGRRQRLLVIGTVCSPSSHCQCPPIASPPPFDLFIADECIWIGSERGHKVMRDFSDEGVKGRDEPLPESYWAGKVTPDLSDLPLRFHQSLDDPLWAKVAEHCLSCGACSAVCPTCACYDVVDQVLLGGEITRQRVWDNCFFRNHGLVAGGYNFRADRTARLRFRFEHKYLGFGAQRGVSSCVGCGRCLDACPVGINLAQILADLPRLEGKI